MKLSIDLTQPAGQIAAAVLFLIPGLIATWVMERVVGRATPTGTERLLRAVAWSVLVYVVSSPWLLPPVGEVVRHEEVSAVGLAAGVTAVVFLTPILVGLAVVWLRRRQLLRRLLRRLTTIPAAPAALEFLFAQRRTDFIRLRLKDGTLVGGLFSDDSGLHGGCRVSLSGGTRKWRRATVRSVIGPTGCGATKGLRCLRE